jgi:hypothetical protein
MKGLFECDIMSRECNFYSKLLPKLGELKFLRTCDYVWHSLEDDERGALAISYLQDFKPIDFRAGLDAELCERTVEQLAELHAKTFHSSASAADFKVQWHLGSPSHCPTAKTVFYQMFETVVEQRLAFLSERQKTNLKRWGVAVRAGHFVKQQQQEVMQRFEKNGVRSGDRSILSIVHGDLWCGNVLCDSQRNVAIIDWQFTARYLVIDFVVVAVAAVVAVVISVEFRSFPMNDIALLTLSSMSSAARRTNTRRLLETYLGAFQAASSDDDVLAQSLTLEDLQNQYRWAAQHAMYVALLSRDAMFGDDDQLADRIEAMVDDVLSWSHLDLDLE